MILLVSSSTGVSKCAVVLEQALGMPMRTVETVRRGITVLRRESFDAVVIDQVLLDADPASVDTLLQHTRMAIAVFVNPAIQGSERVLREVRSALQRRRHEQASAM